MLSLNKYWNISLHNRLTFTLTIISSFIVGELVMTDSNAFKSGHHMTKQFLFSEGIRSVCYTD
jgi:hypothetical protein